MVWSTTGEYTTISVGPQFPATDAAVVVVAPQQHASVMISAINERPPAISPAMSGIETTIVVEVAAATDAPVLLLACVELTMQVV
jgi:hypothetical protein